MRLAKLLGDEGRDRSEPLPLLISGWTLSVTKAQAVTRGVRPYGLWTLPHCSASSRQSAPCTVRGLTARISAAPISRLGCRRLSL